MQKANFSDLQKAITRNEESKKRLTDLRLRDLITDEEFTTKRIELIAEGGILSAKLDTFDNRSNLWMDRMEEALSFCSAARERFAAGTPVQKREILIIVGSNLLLTNKKLTLQPGELIQTVQKSVITQDWLAAWFDFRTYFVFGYETV